MVGVGVLVVCRELWLGSLMVLEQNMDRTGSGVVVVVVVVPGLVGSVRSLTELVGVSVRFGLVILEILLGLVLRLLVVRLVDESVQLRWVILEVLLRFLLL